MSIRVKYAQIEIIHCMIILRKYNLKIVIMIYIRLEYLYIYSLPIMIIWSI